MAEPVLLFGEFLLRNGVISSAHLLEALEYQKETMRVLSVMGFLEHGLEENDRKQLFERISSGESPEAAAAELGFLSAAELEDVFRANKDFRLPVAATYTTIRGVCERTKCFRQFKSCGSRRLP